MRTVWRTFPRHRTVNGILAVLILFSGVVGHLALQPASAKAASQYPTILLIHGFSDYNCASANKEANGVSSPYVFGESGFTRATDPQLIPFLIGYGFTSFDKVGYYYNNATGTGDGICPEDGYSTETGVDIPIPSHEVHDDPNAVQMCNGVGEPTNATVDGTQNEPLEHVSCLLAWYIWDTYTSKYQRVDVIAHSMGGLLIRAALGQSGQANNSNYTPGFPKNKLAVNVAITVGTPHEGLRNIYATGGEVLCNSCTQVEDMLQDVGSPPSAFMQRLAKIQDPQGYEGTYWALMGASYPCSNDTTVLQSVASCQEEGFDLGNDQFPDGDGIVEAVSAMCMQADYRILYGVVTWKQPSSVGIWYPAYPNEALTTAYGHEGYTCVSAVQACITAPYFFSDTSTAYDTYAWSCTACGPDSVSSIDSLGWKNPAPQRFHSLMTIEIILTSNNTAPTIPAPFVVDVPSGGAFYTVWQNTGGAAGPLGEPTNTWSPITGGEAQDFQGGSIYWSPATNTDEVQGDIHSEYTSAWGGPGGGLNFPTSNEQNAYNSSGVAIGRENTFLGTGCTANNQGSIILWSSGTGAHAVIGCIYQKYLALGGTTSFLGLPVSEQQAVNGGHASYFQGTSCGSSTGSGIFDGPASGVHEVHGCIYQEYMVVQGGPTGVLGFPTTDEQGIAGGRVSYFQGTSCGTGGGGGGIFDSSPGVYVVHGCIYQEYMTVQGGPSGGLNFPTSDEQNVYNSSGVAIGRENTFLGTGCTANNQGSAIISSSSTGTYTVIGCIYQKYVALGGTKSFLGLPTSEQVAINNGHASYFQGTSCGSGGGGGGIFDGPASGVHEVHGCIFQEYLVAQGGPAGVLGFPTTDQQSIAGGDVSYFYGNLCGSRGPNNSGSAIYNNGGSSTHQVGGCIYNKYWQMGEANGILGFPVSDVTAIPGGDVSYFAGESCNGGGPDGSGSAVYSGSSGTHEVQGCIYNAYQNHGGPSGLLGFPVSDEFTYDSAGDRESDFQGGYITWNRATGQISVIEDI